jgi:hypothetical protein
MVESVKTSQERIDECLGSSTDRIVATEESQHHSEIYISTSRQAIDRSLHLMNRLRRRI